MLSISVKEFLIWKKKQLSKGGDHQSFAFLLESIGGLSPENQNLLRINQDGILYLEKNLDHLESIWNKHLQNHTPYSISLWDYLLERFKIKSYR